METQRVGPGTRPQRATPPPPSALRHSHTTDAQTGSETGGNKLRMEWRTMGEEAKKKKERGSGAWERRDVTEYVWNK